MPLTVSSSFLSWLSQHRDIILVGDLILILSWEVPHPLILTQCIFPTFLPQEMSWNQLRAFCFLISDIYNCGNIYDAWGGLGSVRRQSFLCPCKWDLSPACSCRGCKKEACSPCSLGWLFFHLTFAVDWSVINAFLFLTSVLGMKEMFFGFLDTLVVLPPFPEAAFKCPVEAGAVTYQGKAFESDDRNSAFGKGLQSGWNPPESPCMDKKGSRWFHVFGKIARKAFPTLSPVPSFLSPRNVLFLTKSQASTWIPCSPPRPGSSPSPNAPLPVALLALPPNNVSISPVRFRHI